MIESKSHGAHEGPPRDDTIRKIAPCCRFPERIAQSSSRGPGRLDLGTFVTESQPEGWFSGL